MGEEVCKAEELQLQVPDSVASMEHDILTRVWGKCEFALFMETEELFDTDGLTLRVPTYTCASRDGVCRPNISGLVLRRVMQNSSARTRLN